MEVLYAETGDSKYRPSMLLRKMVRGGLLGIKSGKPSTIILKNKLFHYCKGDRSNGLSA
jgi:3-hydroxyacyl-CoA dehydrogenase